MATGPDIEPPVAGIDATLPRRWRACGTTLLAASMLLVSARIAAEPWSQQEIVERFGAQIHHWGQKDETLPDKGWASYGVLHLEMLGQRYDLEQAGDELIATARPMNSETPVVRTLSIPQVGMFHAGKKPKNCMPDDFEAIGLGAEFALYLLAQGFPEGPTAAPVVRRDVQAPETEIRFMQGVLRPPQRRAATLSVSATVSRPSRARGPIHFVLEVQGTLLATGDWNAEGPAALVADTDPIAGWRPCWWGQRDRSGALVDAERAAKLEAAKTFGEVRPLKARPSP